MLKLRKRIAAISFIIAVQLFVQAEASTNSKSETDHCLLEALASADDKVTVGKIRSTCQQALDVVSVGVVTQRIAAEAGITERPFVLTAHRPNYVMPYTYNSEPNASAFELINPTRSIDAVETQFQVSFKFPLAQAFLPSQLGKNNDLFVGFTTRAWWQSYNSDISSPFRETDYEPELFVRHHGGPSLGRLKIAGWDLGLAHQSNGQSDQLSRSWNRINGNLALEAGNIALAIRTWYRLSEDGEQDDNPDLHHFLGYGDVRLLYSRRNHMFSAMYRPGTKKNTYEFTWSMPLWRQLRLYMIYFDGYGESLLDYNHRNKRIGIGIGLNDYLDTSGN
jgi:phospholipase A1